MSLAPALSADLGSYRYATHGAAVRVALGLLPDVNAGTLELPLGLDVDAAPGDKAVVRIDGGEGDEVVMSGVIHALRRGLHGTRVEIVDGGGQLAARRPAATFERQSAGDVIRALASEAGVSSLRLDVDVKFAAYVAHPRRTGAEHVAQLAAFGGAIAFVNGDGTLVVQRAATRPELALRYGRELVACDATEAIVAMPRVVVGSGPAGSADAPNALLHTVAVVPEDAPAAASGVVREGHALLRTPGVAKAASEARGAWVANDAVRLSAIGFLLPALRPGMVLEIQDLPDGIRGGAWLVERVTHHIAADGSAGTTFEARSAAPATDLFGALLGAIGGLL
jgi:hypothetical protein